MVNPPSNSACCTQISLPVAAYVNNDAVVAAPLRGAAGYSLYGVQIYGPMENGFTLGQACSNSKGTCDPGWDVTTCSLVLEQQCGTAYVKYTMLLDDCGGHASPYHYHERMHCEYSYLDSSGHSPLIGFMLDGRGLYGQWESDGEKPTNLDACGGHNGTVPTTTKNSVTFNGGSFYHYHVGEFPTLNNCYGPSSSDTAAKAVYPTCSASATSVCTSQGQIDYLVDCPIGVRNLTYTATPTCPYCSGNCGVPTSSPSSLSPTSASPSSAAPTTLAPSSLTPTSASPSSTSPTSLAPTPPTTLAPSSAAPSSAGPTSSAPTVPSTQAPSSSSPSARASAGSLWNAGAMSLVVSGVICVVAGL